MKRKSKKQLKPKCENCKMLLDAVQIWLRFFEEMPNGQLGKIVCDIGLLNQGFIKSKQAIAKVTGK